MRQVKVDLCGKKFGRLTVIKRVEDSIPDTKQKKAHDRWECNCDCGNTGIIKNGDSLRSGHTKSCGCLAKERSANANRAKRKSFNNYEIEGDTVKIFTEDENKIILIDLEDLEKVNKYNWRIDSIGYAYITINKKNIRMHNFIMGDKMYDHIDRNQLNNKKENLRKCSKSQNAMNRKKPKKDNAYSKYKGVTWSKAAKKWTASIKKDYKKYYLGLFTNEEEAAKAYDEAAEKLFGEFACFNFPEEHKKENIKEPIQEE